LFFYIIFSLSPPFFFKGFIESADSELVEHRTIHLPVNHLLCQCGVSRLFAVFFMRLVVNRGIFFIYFLLLVFLFFNRRGKNSESKKKKERIKKSQKREKERIFDRKRCELETVCRMLFIVVLLWMAEVYLSPFARLVIFYMSSMRACVDGASRGGCESERNEP